MHHFIRQYIATGTTDTHQTKLNKTSHGLLFINPTCTYPPPSTTHVLRINPIATDAIDLHTCILLLEIQRCSNTFVCCLLRGRHLRKAVLHFPYYSKCAVWKIQCSGSHIQHSGQSRGVKNLIKGGISIDHVNNTSVNNSNVVLQVGR